MSDLSITAPSDHAIRRFDILVFAALAVVMLATRPHSLSEFVHLPETSLASFLVAGFYIRPRLAFPALFALAFAIGIGLAYAFYRAVTAGTTDAMLGWGLTTIGLLIMQGFLKEWLFARMNMLSILSEVKRLQWQVAQLEKARD